MLPIFGNLSLYNDMEANERLSWRKYFSRLDFIDNVLSYS